MSKGKIERPDLKQVKKRAINGWGAHPDHVLWMIDMLEWAWSNISSLREHFDDDNPSDMEIWNWMNEYGEANGT